MSHRYLIHFLWLYFFDFARARLALATRHSILCCLKHNAIFEYYTDLYIQVDVMLSGGSYTSSRSSTSSLCRQIFLSEDAPTQLNEKRLSFVLPERTAEMKSLVQRFMPSDIVLENLPIA
mgnify:CR=1 FL=1